MRPPTSTPNPDNNQNQNDTPTPDDNNPQDNTGGNDSAVPVSGVWEIVSGYADATNDKGQHISLTYKPGRIGERRSAG